MAVTRAFEKIGFAQVFRWLLHRSRSLSRDSAGVSGDVEDAVGRQSCTLYALQTSSFPEVLTPHDQREVVVPP